MGNKALVYLSAIHSWLEDAISDIDQKLYEFDDGEKSGVKEAKEIGLDTIDEIIAGLSSLKEDINNLSYKGFREKHSISTDE